METELAKAIAWLKREIQVDITRRVREFERTTGLTPSAIDVKMVDVTTHRDPIRKSQVGSVEVDLGSF